MENTNEQNVSGNNNTASVYSDIWGDEPQAETPETPESDDSEGTGEPLEGAAGIDDAGEPEGGDDAEDGAGASEEWEVDGKTYSNEQIAEMVRNGETYKKFNDSMTPLIDRITEYGESVQRYRAIAVTECEKQVKQITEELKRGDIDSREYRSKREYLDKVQRRIGELNDEAEKEKQQRQAAITEARKTNARKVLAMLTQKGWSRQDVQGVFQGVNGVIAEETLLSAMTPEFMELLRDGLTLRAQQSAAAERVKRDIKKNTIKTPVQRPSGDVRAAKPKPGSEEWIRENIWGGK